jgi:hypothetical protein
MHIDRSGLDLLPELVSLRPPVIVQQIDRNAREPGSNGTLSTKSFPAIVGAQQRILGNRLSEVGVSGGVGDKANEPGPITSCQRVDIIELANAPCPPPYARLYLRFRGHAHLVKFAAYTAIRPPALSVDNKRRADVNTRLALELVANRSRPAELPD